MNPKHIALRLLKESSPAFAIADQLAMVGGNFILCIVIARLSSAEDFGRFSVLYALVVLVNALHGPLVSEPISLSRSGPADNISSSKADRTTFIIFAPIAAMICLAANLLGYLESAIQTAALFAACCCSALYWSQKARLHAVSSHRTAFVVSAISSLVMLTSALAATLLTDRTSAGLLGISIGALAGYVLGSLLDRHSAAVALSFRKLLDSAKIGVPSALLIWLANNFLFFFLASSQRLEDGAALRVITTLLLPINQVMIGFSLFLLPRIAHLKQQGQMREAYALSIRTLIASLGAALCIGLAALAASEALLRVTFGPTFASYSNLLGIAACTLPSAWIAVTISRTYMRGSAMGLDLIKIYAIALFFGIPLSISLLQTTSRFGPVNALICIHMILATLFLTHLLRQRHRLNHAIT